MRNGISGPPATSTATTPASWYKSAYDSPGYISMMSSRSPMTPPRPLFCSLRLSPGNRMVPVGPPVPVAASNVPASWNARRSAAGTRPSSRLNSLSSCSRTATSVCSSVNGGDLGASESDSKRVLLSSPRAVLLFAEGALLEHPRWGRSLRWARPPPRWLPSLPVRAEFTCSPTSTTESESESTHGSYWSLSSEESPTES
mmetsp:Transcript_37122/g.71212  ORF Transcript_37122/g.71212 Transcript_37122/m.71212 type:complete len:200 (-) Transcript_37122:1226-1825(-)